MCFWCVYTDKSNVIQVLESNGIDFNCLYSQKRLIFKKRLITFAFSVTPCKKVSVADKPRYDILKSFDLFVAIKYKIRLLKTQVFKS